MSDPLICICVRVTEGEILAALERGAADVEAVRLDTGASSECGDCMPDVQDLIEEADT